MRKTVRMGLVAIAAIAAGAFLYAYYALNKAPQQQASTSAPQTSQALTPESPGAPPKQHYPIPAPRFGTKLVPPLPRLDDSDNPLVSALKGTFGGQPIDAYLVPKQLIRRIVATVDSLDRDTPVPLRLRPAPATPGLPIVERDGKNLTLSPDNSARYQPMVEVLQHLNAKAAAALYFRYYPLFQKAYEQLGYPDRYFNDRLIQVIDHLLAAPDVEGPIKLVLSYGLYQFAGPDLEALSSGQKLMIRIGPKNEAIVKSKLRQLRAAIVSGKPVRGK